MVNNNTNQRKKQTAISICAGKSNEGTVAYQWAEIKMSLSIVLLILLLVVIFFFEKHLKKKKEFTINHLIKMGEFKMVINVIPEKNYSKVQSVELYRNNQLVDPNITQFKEFTFSYYFIGEKGFYLISKITKNFTHSSEFESLSERKKRVFKKYLM